MKRRPRIPALLLAGLLVMFWVCWWLFVPAFQLPALARDLPELRIAGGDPPPNEGVPNRVISYMPLDATAGQRLPVIWSPTWRSSGAGPLLGSDTPEAELAIALSLESPLDYTPRVKASIGRVGPATSELGELAGRHIESSSVVPRLFEGPAKPSGLHLQVDPPVPDLELQLVKLEASASRASGPWTARLVLNVNKEGMVEQALLDHRSGDPDIDAAVVRWAYRLPFGPGWDREFIRLTVRWDTP